MGLGPRGEVSGTVKNILILTDILIALNSTSIGKINIVDNGKVSLKFKGNILTDWLANVFVAVVSLFTKVTFLEMYETFYLPRRLVLS